MILDNVNMQMAYAYIAIQILVLIAIYLDIKEHKIKRYLKIKFRRKK